MPKIIENLRHDLLVCGRKILQEEGCDGLTMRRVAKNCGIALGTIYNYYPSKEVLMASIMLEDWQNALQYLHSRCAGAESPLQCMRLVYNCVADFSAVYEKVWTQYSVPSSLLPFIRSPHRLLISQLEAEIEPVLERFDCLFCSQLPVFLAETLLSAATNPDASFNDLIPVLQKLLQRQAD